MPLNNKTTRINGATGAKDDKTMFTKGQKIAHSISYEMRETKSLFSSLRHAAEVVRMTGGSFTAKDVASLLEITSNYLLSFDQVEEFNAMVKTAQKRAYEMYEKKIKDLEKHCESLEEELGKKEDEFSEYIDKAEELDNLENNIHPEIFDAVCSMMPGDRLTFAQAYECAEAIRNCGRFDASQLRMAI